MSDETEKTPLIDRLANGVFLGLIRLAKALPYRRRIPTMGWLFAYVISPIAGWNKRIRTNLALARPDLSRSDVRALEREVPNNAGRSIAEIYSGQEFIARVLANDPLYGPGLPALEQAAAEGRPVIVACAHFGNYDAMRTALAGRGWPIGALYRPMNNDAFNRHYIPAMRAIAEPMFPRGRSGLAAMLKFLKGGCWLALGYDQFDDHGAELSYFGLPTKTVLTPADLAIRYDALLIPVHGIRQPNGLDFKVIVRDPIPHTTPAEMMQTLNNDLELLVREHMGQWFWIHRRWKRRKSA